MATGASRQGDQHHAVRVGPWLHSGGVGGGVVAGRLAVRRIGVALALCRWPVARAGHALDSPTGAGAGRVDEARSPDGRDESPCIALWSGAATHHDSRYAAFGGGAVCELGTLLLA